MLDKQCPICKGMLTLEPYKNTDVKLEECKKCGYPYLSRMMDYYKERPHKLDFMYAFLEYLNDVKGVLIPKAPNGNIQSRLLPDIIMWNIYDKVRGAIIYAVINMSKTGDFYELRGIYSNPYFAQNECEAIDAENEERGIKAKAHIENILMNHPVGSSMFKKSE